MEDPAALAPMSLATVDSAMLSGLLPPFAGDGLELARQACLTDNDILHDDTFLWAGVPGCTPSEMGPHSLASAQPLRQGDVSCMGVFPAMAGRGSAMPRLSDLAPRRARPGGRANECEASSRGTASDSDSRRPSTSEDGPERDDDGRGRRRREQNRASQRRLRSRRSAQIKAAKCTQENIHIFVARVQNLAESHFSLAAPSTVKMFASEVDALAQKTWKQLEELKAGQKDE